MRPSNENPDKNPTKEKGEVKLPAKEPPQREVFQKDGTAHALDTKIDSEC